jgi:hypothetical protein
VVCVLAYDTTTSTVFVVISERHTSSFLLFIFFLFLVGNGNGNDSAKQNVLFISIRFDSIRFDSIRFDCMHSSLLSGTQSESSALITHYCSVQCTHIVEDRRNWSRRCTSLLLCFVLFCFVLLW